MLGKVVVKHSKKEKKKSAGTYKTTKKIDKAV